MNSQSDNSSEMSTLYDFYASGDISTGLSINQPSFTLNFKPFSVQSGSMDYFRVPPQSWRERLQQLRAAGLNTVTTSIPWSLHEPLPGTFDFGNDSPLGSLLNMETFLKTAQEEDLFAIVRIGPYLNRQLDFGGLPSWLLQAKNPDLRSTSPKFLEKVKSFFAVLLPLLAALQFTRKGPIIALQVEDSCSDRNYLKTLYDEVRRKEIVELLLTSDGETIPDLFLHTITLQRGVEGTIRKLRRSQPQRPIMVTLWSGWYDLVGFKHRYVLDSFFEKNLQAVLESLASFDIYMFHGGTNWGLINGAEETSKPISTSFDFDAPLTQKGGYTHKYEIIRKLLMNVKLHTPFPPKTRRTQTFEGVKIKQQLKFPEILEQLFPVLSQDSQCMELVGQSYGYVIYRAYVYRSYQSPDLIITGSIRDALKLLVNQSATPPDYSQPMRFFLPPITGETTLDFVVENQGRASTSLSSQRKGLCQNQIFLNRRRVLNFKIYSLDFAKKWSKTLKGWEAFRNETSGPAFYRAKLKLASKPGDTFLDMRGWTKGVVVVNGFVLGRYAKVGPQLSLYLPGSFLKIGRNEFLIFEEERPGGEVRFVRGRIYGGGGENKAVERSGFYVFGAVLSFCIVLPIWYKFLHASCLKKTKNFAETL